MQNYYRVFGWAGIVLTFKLKLQKNIEFRHPSLAHPLFFRNHTSDFYTFQHQHIDGEYNMEFGTPTVIFDLGANIGMATIFFKNKFPDALVVSVEPEKSNFELLVKNTEKYDKVSRYNNGIWNRSTNLMIDDQGLGNWGFMVKEVDYENERTIKAKSIHDIMKEQNVDHIDVLKIDIEGSEKELFEKDFDLWMPKVKLMIIELHDVLRAGASKSFFLALNNYNYALYPKGACLIVHML
jgi:FkbM family methyltransferase